MNIRSALLAATVLALPLTAQAQQAVPVTGLYISGDAGVNFSNSSSISSVNGHQTSDISLDSQAGAVGLLGLGWGFGNGLRAEVEFDYRYNGYSEFNAPSQGITIGGNAQKYGPMVNVVYDFNMLSPFVVPYIGVGVGYQWVDHKLNSVSFPGSLGTVTTDQSHNSGGFAYQGIAGVAFPIASVPGLAVDTSFRFLGITSQTYTTDHITFKSGQGYNYGLLIGLRYNFLPPPPPPPAPMAAPAPAPARSYLVFFDWDKATLTPRAQQIIGEAAANSTKVAYTQIQVNGYTDTSGTAQYNQGLSIRRAQAVAAELVKDGVPKGVIAIQGFGETHLLVPTGPGVREPQNRRVEIIIR